MGVLVYCAHCEDGFWGDGCPDYVEVADRLSGALSVRAHLGPSTLVLDDVTARTSDHGVVYSLMLVVPR